MESNQYPGGDNASVNREMLGLAADWLEKCERSHPRCHPADPSFRPTRLLDIGDSQVKIKLVESNSSCSDSIKYACLSHCWGGEKPRCMTTNETIQQNMAGIDWATIPRTFQDAITFTRGLRLRYLWIDSLCIIQGDTEDWLHEGAMMAKIYTNSSITIGATCAGSCKEGLYRESRSGFPERGRGHHGNWITHNTQWHSNHRPLTQRAWFFQEQYLAPRMIHFYYNTILWKCRRAAHSPCENQDYPPHVAAIDKSNSMTAEELWRQWPLIVSPYSACHLSFNSDRLAALSGVAEASGYLRHNYTYVAGLWKKDSGIPLSLDWRRWGSTTQPRPRNNEWAAPSWSWASVMPARWDGSICNHWPSTTSVPEPHPEFTVENINLNLRNSENPFGPLEKEGASITINGYATEGTLLYPDNDSTELKKYAVSFQDGDKPICEAVNFPGDFRIYDENEEGHVKSGSSIVCFWLFTTPPNQEYESNSAIFLVLSQKPQYADQVVFERIGRLDLNPERFNKVKHLMGQKQSFVLV